MDTDRDHAHGETDFQFIRVEQFLQDHPGWKALQEVDAHDYDQAHHLLSLRFNNDEKSLLLIQIPTKDSIRIRFNPGKSQVDEYPDRNTRAIVMDTFVVLTETLERPAISFSETATGLELTTKDSQGQPFMRIVVELKPYRMLVFRYNGDGRQFPVLRDEQPGIYYRNSVTHQFDEQEAVTEYSVVQVQVKPATARYIGFGEKGGATLCKNGKQLTYFNFDNMRYSMVYGKGALEDREPLYHSNPFFMEFNGVAEQRSVYGMFIDNPAETLVDVGCSRTDQLAFGSLYGDLDYYLFLGDSCEDVLGLFTRFVGRTRLKPRFVLGYHQGCYGYDSRRRLEEVAAEYRRYRIPIDGLHVDVDIQNNYQTFTVDTSSHKFPNPQEMFTQLRQKGFKCSTNITPIISNQAEGYETYREGNAGGMFVREQRCNRTPASLGDHYIGEVYYGDDPSGQPRGTTGVYPDLGCLEVREWWGRQYKYLFQAGLEMVWQDMTTPAIGQHPGGPSRGDWRSFPFTLMLTDNSLKKHRGEGGLVTEENEVTLKRSPAAIIRNLYSCNLHKATYHGLNYLEIPERENKRNFIIGRGGFTGMHRFAALWTGDNASNWDFLRINIAQVLALGLSGQSISGADIGGFEPDQDWQHWADPELLIRWTVMGAFLPWFRNHYNAKGNKKWFQEPYAYGQVDLDGFSVPHDERWIYPCVLPVCRHYIELRYRLLQLFYDGMFENTLTGMPIARAMFVVEKQDASLLNDNLKFIDNQFFVGKDLLVAPVIEKQGPGNGYGRRDVYLPAGSKWFLLMNNKRPLLPPVEGGTTVREFDAHISAQDDHRDFICPIYVRAGAIIPTLELEQYVGELSENPLTINVYPGESGEYTLYLDDGQSRSSAPQGDPKYGADRLAKSEYRSTRISHQRIDAQNRRIQIRACMTVISHQRRIFLWRFYTTHVKWAVRLATAPCRRSASTGK